MSLLGIDNILDMNWLTKFGIYNNYEHLHNRLYADISLIWSCISIYLFGLQCSSFFNVILKSFWNISSNKEFEILNTQQRIWETLSKTKSISNSILNTD